MLSEAEYLDPVRFPLTNRQKLSLSDQHLIDAVNHDEGVQMVEAGQELTPRQTAILSELKEKLANVPVEEARSSSMRPKK